MSTPTINAELVNAGFERLNRGITRLMAQNEVMIAALLQIAEWSEDPRIAHIAHTAIEDARTV